MLFCFFTDTSTTEIYTYWHTLSLPRALPIYAANAAWIDPWVRHLRDRGVRFELGARVSGLGVRDRRICAARITDAAGARTVDADYFVVALDRKSTRPNSST